MEGTESQRIRQAGLLAEARALLSIWGSGEPLKVFELGRDTVGFDLCKDASLPATWRHLEEGRRDGEPDPARCPVPFLTLYFHSHAHLFRSSQWLLSFSTWAAAARMLDTYTRTFHGKSLLTAGSPNCPGPGWWGSRAKTRVWWVEFREVGSGAHRNWVGSRGQDSRRPCPEGGTAGPRDRPLSADERCSSPTSSPTSSPAGTR